VCYTTLDLGGLIMRKDLRPADRHWRERNADRRGFGDSVPGTNPTAMAGKVAITMRSRSWRAVRRPIGLPGSDYAERERYPIPPEIKKQRSCRSDVSEVAPFV